MLPCIGDDDDLIGARCSDKGVESFPDGLHGADDGGAELAFDDRRFPLLPDSIHRIDRRQQLDGLAADEAQKALLRRGEEAPGSGIGFRGDDRHADDQPWLLQDFAGAEVLAVELSGRVEQVGRKVRRKREGQSKLRGELRAEIARAQQNDGDVRVLESL